MVQIKKDEHVTSDYVEEHYHYVGGHVREVFDRMVTRAKEKLPEKYEMEKVAQGYKVINERNKQQVFFNCYMGRDGDRIKIIPSNEDFF